LDDAVKNINPHSLQGEYLLHDAYSHWFTSPHQPDYDHIPFDFQDAQLSLRSPVLPTAKQATPGGYSPGWQETKALEDAKNAWIDSGNEWQKAFDHLQSSSEVARDWAMKAKADNNPMSIITAQEKEKIALEAQDAANAAAEAVLAAKRTVDDLSSKGVWAQNTGATREVTPVINADRSPVLGPAVVDSKPLSPPPESFIPVEPRIAQPATEPVNPRIGQAAPGIASFRVRHLGRAELVSKREKFTRTNDLKRMKSARRRWQDELEHSELQLAAIREEIDMKIKPMGTLLSDTHKVWDVASRRNKEIDPLVALDQKHVNKLIQRQGKKEKSLSGRVVSQAQANLGELEGVQLRNQRLEHEAKVILDQLQRAHDRINLHQPSPS
jgi:hypothetical protein